MYSILNRDISRFDNFNTPDNPKIVNLLDWLESTSYRFDLERLRKIEDKAERDAIKATLPAITPSGVFSYRSRKQLIEHSGMIQFDIDEKDNTHINNFRDLKSQIKHLPCVAYVGLSASGRGYWGLIPIKYPNKHKEHFKAILKSFKRYEINIDPAPQNVASLRGYSYDQEGYFNHEAKIYEYLDEPKKAKQKPTFFQSPSAIQKWNYSKGNTHDRVRRCLDKIHSSRVDITRDYKDWVNIGYAFSSEFGEEGREYFHIASQNYSGYDRKETDEQYNQCLRSNGRGVTIASFFFGCKKYGIRIN